MMGIEPALYRPKEGTSGETSTDLGEGAEVESEDRAMHSG